MVSTPAADAQTAPAWRDELKLVFGLSGPTLRALVAGGHPARLGDLVRLLWRFTGHAPSICLTVESLLSRRGAGVSVLAFAPEHAAALNLNRGLIRERASPFVVWAPDTLDERLRREAPDFFDGLGGVVRGVEAVTRESLRCLRRVAPRRVLRWTGPGPLGPVLDAGLGPGAFATVSCRSGYGELRAAAADPRLCVVEGVSTTHDAARLRLALAETRRTGMCVLVRSEVVWPGVEDFGDETLALAEAAHQLEAGGQCDAPALLAALLECDPRLVTLAGDTGPWGLERLSALARARRPQTTLKPPPRRVVARPARGTYARSIETLARQVAVAMASGPVPELSAVVSAQTLGLSDVAQDWLSRQPPTYDDLVRARTLTIAARLSLAAGRYGAAERMLRESLTLLEQTTGRAHVEYGAALHELGAVLSRQGRYEQAERVLRECLALRARTPGHAQARYGASLHELAGAVEKQGRYGEAAALLREALEIDERALGHEHPSYGTSLHALAGVLERLGNYDEAESLLRESLAIKERTIGRDHADYAAALLVLGVVLSKAGHDDQAEHLLQESLDIKERTLGREHPGFAAALHELAGVRTRQGRYPEAEAMLRSCLAIKKRTLGTEHPGYSASLHALALTLERQGRYTEAASLLHESLAITLCTLGAGHPEYAASLGALAVVVWHLGRRTEALSLARQALATTEAALGGDHPDMGFRCLNLAQMLAIQGEGPAATPLAERSVRVFRAALGADHPTTRRAETLLESIRPARD